MALSDLLASTAGAAENCRISRLCEFGNTSDTMLTCISASFRILQYFSSNLATLGNFPVKILCFDQAYSEQKTLMRGLFSLVLFVHFVHFENFGILGNHLQTESPLPK